MSGVPREFAEHALQVYPEVRRIKESMRRLSESKRKAIDIEVNRLLEAKIIQEIKRSTLVANPVLALKKNTEVLYMCIDFTSLNKQCPKDHFPCHALTRSSTLPPAVSASPSVLP
jgi:hypothetical protein